MDKKVLKSFLMGAFILLGVILLILVAKSLYFGLMVIIMEFIFATILDTPVSFLERYNIPRAIGSFVCIFIILGIFLEINLMIIPKATPEFKKLINNAPQVITSLDNSLQQYFYSMNIDDTFGVKYTEVKTSGLQNLYNNMGNILGKLKDKSSEFMQDFTSILMGIIFLWYIVIDPRPLEKGFLDPWTPDMRKKLRRIMLRIKKMLVCWAVALCCGCFAIFLLTWIGLSIVHFPCAFFFAVFAGFMNVIPTLGPILAAILPCLFILITDPKMVIYILIVYGIIQQLESNLITPLIMRKQLNIHPFLLINFILIFGIFFGVLGCFLTAPILAIIGIMYDELYARPRDFRLKQEKEEKELC